MTVLSTEVAAVAPARGRGRPAGQTNKILSVRFTFGRKQGKPSAAKDAERMELMARTVVACRGEVTRQSPSTSSLTATFKRRDMLTKAITMLEDAGLKLSAELLD